MNSIGSIVVEYFASSCQGSGFESSFWMVKENGGEEMTSDGSRATSTFQGVVFGSSHLC
jgi:hypothetical protein